MSDIDLLIMPRADLPVIWDAFKAQVEEFRETAETLIVTDVSQKEKMELACRTRLTLRKIRIAVEHKRVELGEGHLKEIQKVNGAAKAIREFIEPLEARLLVQESFAERVEADRITELAKTRNDELRAAGFGGFLGAWASDLGKMPQPDYDAYLSGVRADRAEREAANRLRVEAERKLAETEAAAKAALELAQRVALEEKQRRDAEAEQIRFEQEKKHRDELSAALAIRTLEREAEAQRGREVVRIEREKVAKLEAELAQERAAKQAEADAARKLALAPDVEKLQAYVHALLSVPIPSLDDPLAKSILQNVIDHVSEVPLLTEFFVQKNLILK